MKRVLGATLALGIALSASAATAQSVKLGALYPFSGGLALLGDESFRGLELAVEERNASGGLNGKKLEIVKGDAVDPNQAVGEARRRHEEYLRGDVQAIPGDDAMARARDRLR